MVLVDVNDQWSKVPQFCKIECGVREIDDVVAGLDQTFRSIINTNNSSTLISADQVDEESAARLDVDVDVDDMTCSNSIIPAESIK
jgi:hypothetical protein